MTPVHFFRMDPNRTDSKRQRVSAAPSHLRVWVVLAACMLVALVAALPVYGQPMIHWGGSITGGGEASFYEDHTRVDVSGNLRLHARTLTHPWRVFFDGGLRTAGRLDGDTPWEVKTDVHRLYVRFYLPSVDLTFGRQSVNWGVGYAWSPVDVFNPPDPTDPQGLRRGIDAAVAQVPVGPLDFWTLALADGKYGVRRRGNLSGTDWSLAFVSDTGDMILGADLKGDLGVGWHAAVAYRLPGDSVEHGAAGPGQGRPGASGSGRPPAGSIVTLLMGADYSWLEGKIFWVGELLVESDRNPGGGLESHTFQQIIYRLDEFSSISGSLLTPLGVGGRLWNISYQTFLSAQSDFRVTLTVFDGIQLPTLPRDRIRLSAQYSLAF